MDTNGQGREIVAVGLEKLTKEAKGGDLELAYSQFPEVPRHEIQRPHGAVVILLGQDYAGYLPQMEREKNHLLLLRSRFGTGRLLSGIEGRREPQCVTMSCKLRPPSWAEAPTLSPLRPCW